MPTTERGPSAEELADPQLSVMLKGKSYRVEPVDGFAFQLLERLEEKSEVEGVETAYKIAFRCLGGALTWEQVFGTETSIGLSPHDVSRILTVAKSQVQQVAATVPNGSTATGRSASRTKNKAQSSPVSRQLTP